MKEWMCVQVGHHKNVGKQLINGKGTVGVSTLIRLLGKQPLSVITCCLRKASETKQVASSPSLFLL